MRMLSVGSKYSMHDVRVTSSISAWSCDVG